MASLNFQTATVICCTTVLCLLAKSFVASSPESEIFSSTSELQKLYKHESEVVSKLEEYAKVLDQNLRVVQK